MRPRLHVGERISDSPTGALGTVAAVWKNRRAARLQAYRGTTRMPSSQRVVRCTYAPRAWTDASTAKPEP